MPTADVSPQQPVPSSGAPGAVGLIGLGEIGQVHATAVRRSRSARLVAVADTAPELLSPFQGRDVSCYSGADELIADPQVGTVCVCLPHHLHFPVSMAAIQAGKNVLVEAPVTGTSALETMRLLDRIYRTAVVLHGRDSPGWPD